MLAIRDRKEVGVARVKALKGECGLRGCWRGGSHIMQNRVTHVKDLFSLSQKQREPLKF